MDLDNESRCGGTYYLRSGPIFVNRFCLAAAEEIRYRRQQLTMINTAGGKATRTPMSVMMADESRGGLGMVLCV